MAGTFRSAPMGFNKKDVIEYIEKLVHDKDALIEAAHSEAKEIETRSAKALDSAAMQAQAERMMAASRISELEKRIAELEQQNAQAAESAAQAMEEAARQAAEAAARLEARIASLEEEKHLLEERALGSETAFGQMEEVAAELRAELNDHRDELADCRAEIESLRRHNVRLLTRNAELEEAAQAQPSVPDEASLPRSAQELFGVFKNRFIEISRELSTLAQAILDAEQREGKPTQGSELAAEAVAEITGAVEVAPEEVPAEEAEAASEETPAAEPAEEAPAAEVEAAPAEAADEDDDDDDQIVETRIELKDYPVSDPPKPAQRRSMSVRDILDRLRTIGDRIV